MNHIGQDQIMTIKIMDVMTGLKGMVTEMIFRLEMTGILEETKTEETMIEAMVSLIVVCFIYCCSNNDIHLVSIFVSHT